MAHRFEVSFPAVDDQFSICQVVFEPLPAGERCQRVTLAVPQVDAAAHIRQIYIPRADKRDVVPAHANGPLAQRLLLAGEKAMAQHRVGEQIGVGVAEHCRHHRHVGLLIIAGRHHPLEQFFPAGEELPGGACWVFGQERQSQQVVFIQPLAQGGYLLNGPSPAGLPALGDECDPWAPPCSAR